MYGNNKGNNLQPRSVVPFSSFPMDTKKLFSAPCNQNTSDIINNRDFSKLEEMLDKDNVDDKHKCLIKQQIAKIQHAKAEEEKQKLLEKEKQAHKDAIAYFEKQEEEKAKLKRQAE